MSENEQILQDILAEFVNLVEAHNAAAKQEEFQVPEEWFS